MISIFSLGECSVIDSIFDTVDSLNINNYAVQARYPDFSIMPEAEEAVLLYQSAVQLNNLVKARITFPE